ncbi:hypothetical protein ONZ45_g5259 [Pleurotus djamor]|nr:hypothetical protein ONZ45_g5259 [Pleurotus djamor]
MPGSSWTLRPATGAASRTYERALGHTELSFHHDSLLNGTSDILRHFEVTAAQPDLFSESNIRRAWCATKQYFPILAAQIELHNNGKAAKFVVCEDDLHRCSPTEVQFLTKESALALEEYVLDAVRGTRRVDSSTLARVFVVRQTDVDSVHILIVVAHAITDGMSNIALLKRFLEEMCSSEAGPTPDIAHRLALALSEEELDPSLSASLPRQRWLRAISEVIRSIRSAKLVGGHTIPQIQNPYDLKVPPKSSIVKIELPKGISKQIITTCRKHSLTFGHAYAVLAQLALTRVICRRYVRGEMSEEEWSKRRVQPVHTGGPLNLRPYLDKEWLKAGGNATMGCAIGFFWYTLPFMPLGQAFHLKPGDDLPSFAELLSHDRFILRSHLVKKQSNHVFKHPLFVGIAKAYSRERVKRVTEVVDNFSNTSTSKRPTSFKPPFVLSFSGSSMGNVELLEQYDYPARLVKEGKQPLIRITSAQTHLRCRPGELYLGSHTSRQQLNMFVFFDGSTYDPKVVEEWLNEVKDAAVWYLGRESANEGARL